MCVCVTGCKSKHPTRNVGSLYRRKTTNQSQEKKTKKAIL